MKREFISGAADRLAHRFTGNNSGNTPTLLMLGTFKFSLNTAVFHSAERGTSWRWAAQERIGQLDALQSTGPGDDRLQLAGVVYSEFRGGTQQLDDLRALGDKMKPQRLIAGSGRVLGMWVIEKVEEVASQHRRDGVARKQEFTIQLRKYSNANL